MLPGTTVLARPTSGGPRSCSLAPMLDGTVPVCAKLEPSQVTVMRRGFARAELGPTPESGVMGFSDVVTAPSTSCGATRRAIALGRPRARAIFRPPSGRGRLTLWPRTQGAQLAQRVVALGTRRHHERLEQERTGAPSSMRHHEADRQLRRLRVDGAVPTVALGQEAHGCRADRWPNLGDHPQIARRGPPLRHSAPILAKPRPTGRLREARPSAARPPANCPSPDRLTIGFRGSGGIPRDARLVERSPMDGAQLVLLSDAPADIGPDTAPARRRRPLRGAFAWKRSSLPRVDYWPQMATSVPSCPAGLNRRLDAGTHKCISQSGRSALVQLRESASDLRGGERSPMRCPLWRNSHLAQHQTAWR